jgi:hypothetical protein
MAASRAAMNSGLGGSEDMARARGGDECPYCTAFAQHKLLGPNFLQRTQVGKQIADLIVRQTIKQTLGHQ